MRQATNKSEQAYRLYIDKLEAKLATERAITRRKLNEARHDLRNNGRGYGKYQNFQVDNPGLCEKHHHGKLEHHLHLMDIAKQNIEENKNKLEHLKSALPTEKEFYELIKLHPLDLLEVNDITKLDLICNELVTNLRAVNNSICYKTKSTIQFAGGFRRNLFWSGCSRTIGTTPMRWNACTDRCNRRACVNPRLLARFAGAPS